MPAFFVVPSGPALAEQLFDDLCAFVPAIARRVASRAPASIGIEDLAQIGRAALWQECLSYDPARGSTFRSYCKMRIRGSMLDWIRIDFPEASRERDALRFGHGPDNADTCPDNKYLYVSGDLQRDPFVARAVDQLAGRQADVVCLRFVAGMSRSEAGERLGISRDAVGRAERGAIARLRGLLKAA
jgi:RNA polymerase sigma factor (sigma-70 family)